MNDPLTQQVLSALGEVAPELDEAALAPTRPLREQLDLDSMDFLRFVQALARTTGVEVPESDYPRLLTLQGCAQYLASRASPPKS